MDTSWGKMSAMAFAGGWAITSRKLLRTNGDNWMASTVSLRPILKGMKTGGPGVSLGPLPGTTNSRSPLATSFGFQSIRRRKELREVLFLSICYGPGRSPRGLEYSMPTREALARKNMSASSETAGDFLL